MLRSVIVFIVALALTGAWLVYRAEPIGVLGPYRSYRLVWHDEFNGRAGGSPDPAKWQVVSGGGGWGGKELECYTARTVNVSFDGRGDLAITARKENWVDRVGHRCGYTSGRLQTLSRLHVRYGRIEARIKLPAGRGLWPAFWALGADYPRVSWPKSGEIDMMENNGLDPFIIYGSIHGPAPTRPDEHIPYEWARVTKTRLDVAVDEAFHTFGVDWGRGEIVFTVDGKPYVIQTPFGLGRGEDWVFEKPFYLLLNLAVGGNFPGRPSASTAFPATMLVDWVRVYAGMNPQ